MNGRIGSPARDTTVVAKVGKDDVRRTLSVAKPEVIYRKKLTFKPPRELCKRSLRPPVLCDGDSAICR